MIAPLAVLATTNGRRSLPWLALPVAVTLPMLIDIRFGPFLVLLVLTYLLLVIRNARFEANERSTVDGAATRCPAPVEARL
jgi:hypothetical protein